MGEKVKPPWFKGVVEGGKITGVPTNPVEQPTPQEDVNKTDSEIFAGKVTDILDKGLSAEALSDVVKEMFLSHVGGETDEIMQGAGDIDKSARQYSEIVRSYDIETLRVLRDHPDTAKKPAFKRAIKNELTRRMLNGEDKDQ